MNNTKEFVFLFLDNCFENGNKASPPPSFL